MNVAPNKSFELDLTGIDTNVCVFGGWFPIGVVTEDTLIHFVYGHPDLLTAPVKDAMESAFIKLDKSESLNNLVAMLHVQPYAAIMDGEEFLGLITRSDVLNYLRRQM